MALHTLLAASAALLIPLGALAASGDAPSSNETQEVPQASNPQPAADPYAELNKRVQEKLQQRGFYDGPVNGDFGSNTQAALAQFQLSVPLPASGMLDDTTLAALGIEPPGSGESSSAGASPPEEREADPASTGPAAAR
jgi:peptidoglycan hydrolase-like protein with peptidoglycan-binding domain